MKRFLFVFCIGFIAFKTHAQPSVDIGIFGGGASYLGDMIETEWQKSINPAYGAFIRYNFNPRYGLRLNVFNGDIGATGQIDSKALVDKIQFDNLTIETLPVTHSFKKNVLDVSIQFEFNYFKYIVGDKPTPYSTYLFGGIGLQRFDYNLIGDAVSPSGDVMEISGTETTPVIPFGVGFKFNLSKRIGLGIETGFRKSFSDKLDNLDDPLSYTDSQGIVLKYADEYHNNDWAVYSGVHLVYKLYYGNKEWTLRTPKKHILDWGIENNLKNR